MSSATMTIDGMTAEPRSRVSQSGRRMTDLAVAHTPRRFNKQSQQYEDVLDQDGQKITTWARATFFDEMADVVANIGKGTLVTMTGEPRVNVYTNNQGQPAASLDLQFASVALVVQKPRQNAPQGGFGGGSPQGQGSWASAPAQAPQNGAGGFDDSAPF